MSATPTQFSPNRTLVPNQRRRRRRRHPLLPRPRPPPPSPSAQDRDFHRQPQVATILVLAKVDGERHLFPARPRLLPLLCSLFPARVHAQQARAAPPWRRCGGLCPAPPLLLGLASRAPHRWSTTRPPSASTPRLWSSTPRLACATARGRCTATASELHRPCPGARRQHCPRSASSHASSTACCYFAPLAAAASHSCCWRFPPPDYKPEISIRRLSPGARPLGSTFCTRLLYAPGRWMWPWMGIAASISPAISAGSAIYCLGHLIFIRGGAHTFWFMR